MTPDTTDRITPNPEILNQTKKRHTRYTHVTDAYGPQQHDPYAAGKISAKTIKNNALLASFYYYARASRPPVTKR
jgi:hypothetical protein